MNRLEIQRQKTLHRAQREAHRESKRQKPQPAMATTHAPLDCACVIHGNVYEWKYVDTLYNMLCRNITRPIRLHVYTESDRHVPEPYIKHALEDWGIGGPKRSWWYKIQMFNQQHHAGPLLYFDLDVVIVRNIDWVWQLNQRQFWALKDFKHIWRPTHQGINSSMMWWDTVQYDWIWQEFKRREINNTIRRYPGDQDFISELLDQSKLCYFDNTLVKSWRWQALDGGFDFRRRTWHTPGTGTDISDGTAVLIFHGKPKPDQTPDPVIQQHWR